MVLSLFFGTALVGLAAERTVLVAAERRRAEEMVEVAEEEELLPAFSEPRTLIVRSEWKCGSS